MTRAGNIFGQAMEGDSAGCCIVLRVANLPHVAAAYGEPTAERALGILHAAIRDHCYQAAAALAREDRPRRVPIMADVAEGALFLFLPAQITGRRFAEYVSELLMHVVARAIQVRDSSDRQVRLRLMVDARWWLASALDEGRAQVELRELEIGAEAGSGAFFAPVPQSPRQVGAFRSDMEMADEALTAISKGWLHLAWQPSLRAQEMDGGASVLYFEALARLMVGTAGIASAERHIGALERTGLIRAFDREVALRVVHEMETAVADVALAFNISALSAVDDLWWVPFWDSMKRNPAMAGRLFVEITSAAPFAGLAAARNFAARVQKEGGHVVLDGFGTGRTSISEAVTLSPDFVKIPGVFLAGSTGAICSGRCFGPLAQFAISMGAGVIAEHIESDEDRRFAADHGAHWCQGNHLAAVSLLRPWIVSGGYSGGDVSRALMELHRLRISANSYGSESDIKKHVL